MMRTGQQGADRRGVALVAALAIVTIVGTLVLGAIITTQVEQFVTRNDSTSAQAQYVAQAGLQTYKATLFQNFRWLEGGGTTGTLADACSNNLQHGIDYGRNDTLTPWNGNQIGMPFNDGGLVVDAHGNEIGRYAVTIIRDPTNASRFTLQSVGQTTGTDATRARSTARATILIRNSSTLEQAIFAGTGSGMRFLNGNTTIYGGVYIVGNRAQTDPHDLVFESNGNLSMFNAYDKTNLNDTATLREYLVDPALKSNNLCAALRVEAGRIAIGGSTQLGTPTNPLLTVAVGKGLEDIDNSMGGSECMTNKGVCVETTVGPFDIANPPDFPELDEILATELCPSPNTWRDCIREEARDDGFTISNFGFGKLEVPSDLDLPPECQAFLDAAAIRSDRTVRFDGTAINCTVQRPDGRTVGFSYTITGSFGSLQTYGNINMRGFNLDFARPTTYRATSRAKDTGTERTFANLSIERLGGHGGDFSVRSTFAADQVHGRFPDNVLTVVAESNASLRGGNNTYVTAPIYAGQQIRIREQTQLYGQVIANEFCTTNVNDVCNVKGGGSPAEVIFVPTGENRPDSFRAIAPTGGLPTFKIEAYELR